MDTRAQWPDNDNIKKMVESILTGQEQIGLFYYRSNSTGLKTEIRFDNWSGTLKDQFLTDSTGMHEPVRESD